MSTKKRGFFSVLLIIFLLSGVFVSCIPENNLPLFSLFSKKILSPLSPNEVTVIFNAILPAALPGDHKIYLDLLDDLTGIPLNPYRYTMVSDSSTHFHVRFTVRANSIIKYRYVLGDSSNSSTVETTSSAKPVHYRLFYTDKTTEVTDLIFSFDGFSSQSVNGRLQGLVTDSGNRPLSDILISAGGKQTITSANGFFMIDGLPEGVHNFVAFSITGDFKPFQQGVLIAPNSTTPVNIQLETNRKVWITFSATANTPDDMPLLFFGEYYGMGNSYADLGGGINSPSFLGKRMEKYADGHYEISLQLPVDQVFHYKYSFGDGFWNSELNDKEHFNIREIRIPDADHKVEDSLINFSSSAYAPITFVLIDPSENQIDDRSIQFNPYEWMPPLAMQRIDEHVWQFTLTSPLKFLGNVLYRFCRNNQCDSASGFLAGEPQDSYQSFSPSTTNQIITNTISTWTWMPAVNLQYSEPNNIVKPRDPTFIAGLEFQPNYQLSWQPYFDIALKNIQQMGANWVVLTPTWSTSSPENPILEPKPGKDMLNSDLLSLSLASSNYNLNIAINPQLIFPEVSDLWWGEVNGDSGWWISWLDRYRVYLKNFAKSATACGGSPLLILGDPSISPSLPGVTRSKYANLGYPIDLENRWIDIISEIHTEYPSIRLYWTLVFPDLMDYPSELLTMVDGFYVEWNAPLNLNGKDPDVGSIEEQISSLLDEYISPIKSRFNKPVILAIKVPAVEDAAFGCLDPMATCQSFDLLDQPSKISDVELNLDMQTDLIQAFLTSINDRPWLDGIVIRGYFPPIALQDGSSSINGKPAETVVHYWFPKYVNNSR